MGQFAIDIIQWIFMGLLVSHIRLLEKKVDKLEEVLRRIRRF